MSSTLAGRFLTTGPPGKSCVILKYTPKYSNDFSIKWRNSSKLERGGKSWWFSYLFLSLIFKKSSILCWTLEITMVWILSDKFRLLNVLNASPNCALESTGICRNVIYWHYPFHAYMSIFFWLVNAPLYGKVILYMPFITFQSTLKKNSLIRLFPHWVKRHVADIWLSWVNKAALKNCRFIHTLWLVSIITSLSIIYLTFLWYNSLIFLWKTNPSGS